MKLFESLTVRGKARRLRPLALAALESYDIDVDRVELVRNDLNGIFRVRASDGASYMLRVCLPNHHELATIQSEALWLEALASDPDISAPRPIPARRGAAIVTASALGVPEPRHCMLFSWLPGRDLQRVASTEHFEKLGRLMARLHRHSRHWQPPESFRVRALDRLYPFGDPQGLIGPAHQDYFEPETRELIERMERAIQTELLRLYTSGQPQVVHGDLHWGNVKVYRGKLQPLDFEDLALAFPIQDIAISLFYSLNDLRFTELRRAFQTGYAAVQLWPQDWTGQLDLLIVHRGLDLFNYLLAANFPGRERWFPAFVANIHERYRAMANIDSQLP